MASVSVSLTAKITADSLSLVAFNVVWQSKALQPFVDVKWVPEYGFNWTADAPGDGVSVTIRGRWQECKTGQIYDLNQYGVFTKSSSAPVPGYLAIGNNDFYTDDSPNGIHIVIGIKNKAGSFDPIFVDSKFIAKGMNGKFQPQEKLQWWYDAGAKSATMFQVIQSKYETGDFSEPDQNTQTYKKKSQYNYTAGTWNTEAVA